MKFTPSKVAAAGVLFSGTALAGCQNIGGNYYCNEVEQIVYNNIGFSGSYNRVTSFNNDGTCSSTPQAFSGSIAPLDEELSIHFRGPIELKQVAVYGSASSPSKREIDEAFEKRDEEVHIAARHGHHVHKRAYVTEYDYVTRTIVVGANGEPSTVLETVAAAPPAPASSSVSVALNNFALAQTGSSVIPDYLTIDTNSVASVPAPASPTATTVSTSAVIPSSPSQASSNAPASSSSPLASGSGWSQNAYYNSESQTASGLAFFNNLGGGGSGVFDYTFGNSLSYAGSDGVSCAASPQTLQDTLLPSNKEVIIFSDSECTGNDCGYYRPGIPAYHGFGGSTKLFLFEFGMPHSTSGEGFNYDMPAIWFLNAQIPRTLQYGAASCSCWTTGCGEFDVFEVLNAGNEYLTNHLHDEQGTNTQYGGGGSSDYFARPTSGTMKAAVLFDGSAKTITIVKLDNSVSFDSELSFSTVSGWISSSASSGSSVNIAS